MAAGDSVADAMRLAVVQLGGEMAADVRKAGGGGALAQEIRNGEFAANVKPVSDLFGGRSARVKLKSVRARGADGGDADGGVDLAQEIREGELEPDAREELGICGCVQVFTREARDGGADGE